MITVEAHTLRPLSSSMTLQRPSRLQADDVLADELGDLVLGGLLVVVVGEVGAGDQVEAGVVRDLGGQAHLTADVHGDDDRREVLAGGVHGGREAGGAGADDRDVVDVAQRRPLAAAEPPVELARGVQPGEVVVAADLLAVQKDLGHAAHARALDHLGLARLVCGHVDLVVGDVLGAQQRLCLEAVRTPFLGVDLDLSHASFLSATRRRRRLIVPAYE